MVLRRQELPSEEEFALASDRAVSVFGLGRPPVRSARAVQALAAELRRQAGSLLPAAESLAAELARHAATLGLADDSPRLVTARTAAELLNRLTGLADSTALLRALAASDLPREGAVYRASVNSAADLTASLGRLKWQILDQLAALAAGGNANADAAASTRDQLRSAACHDEHQVPLRKALDLAEQAAIALLIDSHDHDSDSDSDPDPDTGERVPFKRRVTAAEVASVAEELCETADQNPEASFDITWRIVTG
jgi:hypothetical protein